MVCATSIACYMIFAQAANQPLSLQRPPDWRDPVTTQEQLQQTTSPEEIIYIVKTVGVIAGPQEADSMRVQPNPDGAWSHGFILARPGRAIKSEENMLEVSVYQGRRTRRSAGQEFELRVSYENVYKTFSSRDDNTNYIFEYVQSEMNSKPELIRTYTSAEFLDVHKVRRIPQLMKAGSEITNLPANVALPPARISRVERVGAENPECLLHLRYQQSAPQAAANASPDIVHRPQSIVATSEKFCQHGAAMMALNEGVEIEAAETGGPNPYVAKVIKFIIPDEQSGPSLNTEEGLEKFKDELTTEITRKVLESLKNQGNQPK